ncbi:histone deacetylase family protein [Oxynema aestuarii]|jgi:acetoin utilization deacetylase AcuC-like enzyme|uniref:Histone deacetylase n=1 Tax=Oxynema aestuarii AP17 TaxID=2064643 RepID=A0A6H1U3B1_9CYAN|nr:histone deacetylase [Oxynema aestuarii]QIZ72857.1 histone deacetylase [Oxynema aestuarii AP17]RMH76859.1 MAG: histone deacetylase [Cyanobacteria bacterium J007]
MFSAIYCDEFLLHDTGRGHPERPDRLRAIVKALKSAPWADRLHWQQPTPPNERAVSEAIARIHTRRHVHAVETIAHNGGGGLDLDTPVSPRSYEVAELAVSAWLDGIDWICQTGDPAFVLARPPGHHATPDRGMGFCLFSNAAIAAYYAIEQCGVERVGILDWDVHHGNGTQEIVETHPQMTYCSLHQFPCYPGTGRAEETGSYNNVLNIPMKPGSTGAEYKQAFDEKIMPFFENFKPDILIVSAGYDGNSSDPLAGIDLQPEDFGVFTNYCLQLTRRIVFGLEGGYELDSLSRSVLATIAPCL